MVFGYELVDIEYVCIINRFYIFIVNGLDCSMQYFIFILSFFYELLIYILKNLEINDICMFVNFKG